MSGYGKPFREFTLEKVNTSQCMLPSKVSTIQDYDTCMVMMDQCKQNASLKAEQRNDPRYLQYAQWFDGFAEQDKSIRTLNQQGDGDLEFFGGCKILLMKNEQNRNKLWSSASNSLYKQLERYHNNQPFTGQEPTVKCASRNNKFYCL